MAAPGSAEYLRVGPADPTYRDLFRAVARASAILDVGAHIRFRDVSQSFLDLFGVKREQLIGLRLEEAMTEDGVTLFDNAVRRTLSAEQPVCIQAAFTIRGAKYRGDFKLEKLRGAGFGILLTSDTQHRPAPATELRYAAMFDTLSGLSDHLSYIFDLSTQKTRYLNTHLADLLGYPPSSIVGLGPVREMIHEYDLAHFDEHVAGFAALRDNDVARGLFRLRRADGQWRWLDNRARVFSRTRSGKVRRVIGCAFDVTEPRKVADDLHAILRSLLQAEQRERERIARELHDGVMQYLVAVKLGLGSLRRALTTEGMDRTITDNATNLLDLALTEMRTLSFLMHPPELKERGLAATLETFIHEFGNRAGLGTRFTISGEQEPLSAVADLALLRVVQESLMNVHRHARAQSIDVRLMYEPGIIQLEVQDDGVGIGLAGESVGVGITGMRARVAQLGGHLSIDSLDPGTRVRAILPISA